MIDQRPVLVLEDDAAVAEVLHLALTRDGWRTEAAGTLAEGLVQLEEHNPRIVVVDLGLPDGNGISFVREAAARSGLGIIVVSGRDEEVDRVVGLEVGADDYVTKPFSPREVAARVRALSRRLDGKALPAAQAPPPATPDSMRLGRIVAKPAAQRLVAADGRKVRLTGAEAELLALLLTEPDRLASRDRISERVLGYRLLPEQRGADQLVSSLRRKLLDASEGTVSILAVRSKGYRLMH